MGRTRAGQRVQVDWKAIDKYLVAGCNGVQVASVLGINEDTIYKHCRKKYGISFPDYCQRRRATGGGDMLRYRRLEKVITRGTSVLVWISKPLTAIVVGKNDKW